MDRSCFAKRWLIALAVIGCCDRVLSQPGELSLNQQLIVACYRLQVQEVTECLRKGADANAMLGNPAARTAVVRSPWTGGIPLGSTKWTPLLAVAASPPEPPPAREFPSTAEGWIQQANARASVPAEQLAEREALAVRICQILYSHDCDLERDDGHGATAVYLAAGRKRADLLRQLLKYGANPNVKVGVYIDGPGNLTPLHAATPSREAMQLLLDYGANPEARDSEGDTPGDWLKLQQNGFRLVKTPNGWRLQATE